MRSVGSMKWLNVRAVLDESVTRHLNPLSSGGVLEKQHLLDPRVVLGHG